MKLFKCRFWPFIIGPLFIAALIFASTAPNLRPSGAAMRSKLLGRRDEPLSRRDGCALIAPPAPLAPNVEYAQDNVRLKIGQALWATATARGKYIHYFADPEQGDVGVITVIYENGVGAILIARLKVQGGLITQAEQFVAHDPRGAAAYEKSGQPDPGMATPIPLDRRETRAALDQAAYMYYEGLQLNDGKGVYAFTPDCNRTEDAVRTTNQPRPQNYGHSDEDISDFTTMNCTDQYKLGFLGFTTSCRHRRFLVTDVERGR